MSYACPLENFTNVHIPFKMWFLPVRCVCLWYLVYDSISGLRVFSHQLDFIYNFFYYGLFTCLFGWFFLYIEFNVYIDIFTALKYSSEMSIFNRNSLQWMFLNLLNITTIAKHQANLPISPKYVTCFMLWRGQSGYIWKFLV